jgi:DNA polymerase-3 subunit gamma/tau
LASPSRIVFDGNWPAFVERLSLSGMAGLLARHGELVSCEGNHLQLVVPEAQKMYAEKPYQDKLKSELSAQFGPGFRLTVRVGPTRGASVAAARSVESQRRLESAAQAIEQDPFVRDLVKEMGAEVVPSSIRPAGEAGPDRNDDRRRKP